MVWVHGLFDDHKNFTSISSHPSISEYVNSYIVDLRNHGDSPICDSMKIPEMAEDIARFIEKSQIDNVFLMGHSMGGKIIMSILAEHP